MQDEEKTRKQLISELKEMLQRLARLEESEAGRKKIEEAIRKSEE